MQGDSGSRKHIQKLELCVICVICVFKIRLVNSVYPMLVCLRNLLLISDLIYTGKLEIPSVTKGIFMQKYVIPRIFVNYTKNQVLYNFNINFT